jgi:hypothetical protein
MGHYEPLIPTEPEPSSSPEEVGDRHGVSSKTIRRLFEGEAGVILMRPRGDAKRRPRYLMRIPHSVERRVFAKLAVKRPGKAA